MSSPSNSINCMAFHAFRIFFLCTKPTMRYIPTLTLFQFSCLVNATEYALHTAWRSHIHKSNIFFILISFKNFFLTSISTLRAMCTVYVGGIHVRTIHFYEDIMMHDDHASTIQLSLCS